MKVVDCLIGKKLSGFLRRAARREKVVIARAGVTVVGSVWPGRKEPRRPGLARGRLTEAFFDPLPVDELAAWQQ